MSHETKQTPITSTLQLGVLGEVLITDDLGNTVLEKTNAVHPQNMSRIIARALASEPNSGIYRVAFGSGGTFVDATGTVSFRTVNDGNLPDTANWESRLYNEVYSEVIDDSSSLLGSGVGTVPGGDASVAPTGVVSLELPTLKSQVVITCVLNKDEPSGQVRSSLSPTTAVTDFTFDEIGLFSAGLPRIATQGYQDVLVGGKTFDSLTGLTPNTFYAFDITVDGILKNISITTPSTGTGLSGAITYEDLNELLNTALSLAVAGCNTQVSEPGVVTYGALRFVSITAGANSSVNIFTPSLPYPSTWLFSNLTGFTNVDAGHSGQAQGTANNPSNPASERERLLSHLIFSPLVKTADRIWTILYKITVTVAQSNTTP
jgi:hypothetical protein